MWVCGFPQLSISSSAWVRIASSKSMGAGESPSFRAPCLSSTGRTGRLRGPRLGEGFGVGLGLQGMQVIGGPLGMRRRAEN
jgi:hypothetical protein